MSKMIETFGSLPPLSPAQLVPVAITVRRGGLGPPVRPHRRRLRRLPRHDERVRVVLVRIILVVVWGPRREGRGAPSVR